MIAIDEKGLPTQTFNGKVFRLYRGERYFSRGRTRMHVAVWEYYHGKVPAGYHIHHKNENTHDNRIENLEAKPGGEHISEHSKKRFNNNEAWARSFQEAGIAKAPDWHRSDAGRKWHSEHALQNTAHIHQNSIDATCDCCGISFKTSPIRQNRHRFCSNKCKSKWRRDNKVDHINYTCSKCNKVFVASKYDSRQFCGRSCAMKKY
jgi:ribosomal protein S27AE